MLVELPAGRVDVLDLPGSEPPFVLLHEALGSIGLWRGLPDDLHATTGRRTIAYSRLGHGRSDPPPRPHGPGWMHEHARETLPALLRALGVARPLLVGHSDGASIALIHAAEHPVAGVVAIAPHVLVEEVCLAAIERVRGDYDALRARLARHHDDPDVTFAGWAGVWLDPAFRDWTLESLLPGIDAPVLVIQGADDEYATLAQVDAVARGVSGPVETRVLPGGHAPHLEHRDEVVAAVAAFARMQP